MFAVAKKNKVKQDELGSHFGSLVRRWARVMAVETRSGWIKSVLEEEPVNLMVG